MILTPFLIPKNGEETHCTLRDIYFDKDQISLLDVYSLRLLRRFASRNDREFYSFLFCYQTEPILLTVLLRAQRSNLKLPS